MRRFQSFAALAIALLFTNSTSAQTYTAEVERQAGQEEIRYLDGIRLEGGSFGGWHYAQKMNAEIELNAEDRTVIFHRVAFEVPLSGNFASGFGQSVFIEGKIIAEFTDDNPLPLTSNVGNEFDVNDFPIWIPRDRFSVTYEFSGPTERVKETFTWSALLTHYWRRYWDRDWDRGSPIIDTTDYPNEVDVINRPRWRTWSDSKTINENIDGADISFFIAEANLLFPESLKFTLKPDPSEITGIRFEGDAILISGMGTIGISDSAAGPFSGEIDLPAIIQPESSAKFFKAN